MKNSSFLLTLFLSLPVLCMNNSGHTSRRGPLYHRAAENAEELVRQVHLADRIASLPTTRIANNPPLGFAVNVAREHPEFVVQAAARHPDFLTDLNWLRAIRVEHLSVFDNHEARREADTLARQVIASLEENEENVSDGARLIVAHHEALRLINDIYDDRSTNRQADINEALGLLDDMQDVGNGEMFWRYEALFNKAELLNHLNRYTEAMVTLNSFFDENFIDEARTATIASAEELREELEESRAGLRAILPELPRTSNYCHTHLVKRRRRE